jgi:PilZ domain
MVDPLAPAEAEFTLFRNKLFGIKRRTTERYRCALATSGRLFLPGTGDTMVAWVINLSVGGMGLNLPEKLAEGQALTVHLKAPESKLAVAASARVVHVTAEVDGTWRVGCAFDQPLPAETLDTLLYGSSIDSEVV